MQYINVPEHSWIVRRKKGREASAIKERNDDISRIKESVGETTNSNQTVTDETKNQK
jgi:hypothetical protein